MREAAVVADSPVAVVSLDSLKYCTGAVAMTAPANSSISDSLPADSPFPRQYSWLHVLAVSLRRVRHHRNHS